MRHSPATAQKVLGLVNQSLTNLDRDLPALVAALREAQAGYPSSTIGGGGRGGDVPRPTERLALLRSRASDDTATFYRAVDAIYGWAVVLRDLSVKYSDAPVMPMCSNPKGCPSMNAAAKGRRGLCEACAKHKSRHGDHRTSKAVAA